MTIASYQCKVHGRQENDLLPVRPNRHAAAIRRARAAEQDFVPHLRLEEVQKLARHAQRSARKGKGERDALLIQTLFDGCFRVSEAVALTPASLLQTPHGWVARITRKGSKTAEVAIFPSLASRLLAYAYGQRLQPEKSIFPIGAVRVWQIMDRAFQEAGLRKPENVGAVHVLRHSGAIARLEATGNPKAVQDQLRHREARMTQRYLETLSSMESIRVQQ